MVYKQTTRFVFWLSIQSICVSIYVILEWFVLQNIICAMYNQLSFNVYRRVSLDGRRARSRELWDVWPNIGVDMGQE